MAKKEGNIIQLKESLSNFYDQNKDSNIEITKSPEKKEKKDNTKTIAEIDRDKLEKKFTKKKSKELN